jgi:O-antigen/teichoic acid export membrane protein
LGVIKRQAFQSSVLLYTGTIIGFITTGLITPNLLSESEIGTLRLLLSYSAIFMSFAILGFSTVTIRYVPQLFNRKSGNHHGFLGVSMLVGTIGLLLTTGIIELIRPTIIENNQDKSPQFAQYFILIIPLTIFQTYYTLFDSYNNALYRSSFGVFLRDFVQRILILIGLSLLLVHLFDFENYVYYYVGAICIPTILILIDIIRHGVFDIKISAKIFNKAILGSMASVGLFGLLNSMSNIAALQIDAIMINMYLNDAAVGIYVITFYFGTLVFIPSKALNRIAPSLISKAFKENNLETIKDIYYRSCKNLFLIGTLILLGLAVNLENVFNIIPSSYEEGKFIILLIGLANLIKMLGGTNDSVITYSKYFRTTTLFLVIFSISIIVFNFLLIPSFGITGAGMATLFSIVLHNLIKFIFIKMKFDFMPYNYQFILVLVFAAIIYFIISIIPNPGNFILDILLDSFLTTVLFYLAVRWLSISIDLNNTFHQILQKTAVFFKTKI